MFRGFDGLGRRGSWTFGKKLEEDCGHSTGTKVLWMSLCNVQSHTPQWLIKSFGFRMLSPAGQNPARQVKFPGFAEGDC